MDKSRIESIDILRGVVMVLMALDHCREYFHLGAFVSDPTDLAITTPILFFTRFITYYCAPIFVFLAGTSSFLYGSNKTKQDLSLFLLSRGVWLLFAEIIINNFFWWFDIHFGFINLQVLWAIGLSMIAMSLLMYLPNYIFLSLSILIIFGHNLLDFITANGSNPISILWYILHQSKDLQFSDTFTISFFYPFLPWLGIMMLGYSFGRFYTHGFDKILRKKWLMYIGLASIALFFIVRGVNIYGELIPWSTQKNIIYTVISFFNITKYPPSLLFILWTLGLAFVFLAKIEGIKNRLTNIFLVFGRVPFLYYLIHILIIHLVAMLGLVIIGGDWKLMILDHDTLFSDALSDYGYSLIVVYLVWFGIVALMYPLCKMYMIYKNNNKEKWWLSYL